MQDIYKMLFLSYDEARSDTAAKYDAHLRSMMVSLKVFEESRHRLMTVAAGRGYKQQDRKIQTSMYDFKDRANMWNHATDAWRDGWLLPTMSCAAASVQATVPEQLPPIEMTTLGPKDVQDLGDNQWKAQGYIVEAACCEDALPLLQAKVDDEARARRHAARIGERRATDRARMGERDRTQTDATRCTLRATGGVQHHGRLIDKGREVHFVEDATNFEATFVVPDDMARGTPLYFRRRDESLCKDMAGFMPSCTRLVF